MGATASHDSQSEAATRRPPYRPPPLGQRAQEVREPPLGIPAPPIATTSGNTIPVHAHPPVQQKSIVRNSLSLQKNTLRVIPSPHDSQILLVDFEFNADVPGNITVYYHAREIITYSDGTTTVSPVGDGGRNQRAPVLRLAYDSDGRPAARTPFPAGHSQWYRQHPSRGLDTRLYSTEKLQADGSDGRYALVVRLEAAQRPSGEEVSTQTTFAILENLGQQGWATRVIGQQVLIQGSVYKMMELFGIGARNITASKSQDGKDDQFRLDSNQECVVCLSEVCTTAIRPCHHLCLCADCARIICSETNENRRRCPVCRTKIESVFSILPPPIVSSNSENIKRGKNGRENNRQEQIQSQTSPGSKGNSLSQIINEAVLHPDGIVTSASALGTNMQTTEGSSVQHANGLTNRLV